MAATAQLIHATLANAAFLAAANAVLALLVLFWMLRFRQAHRRTVAGEQMFRATIENLAEGFYRSSLEGIQLYANRSLVHLNGYSDMEEMLACVSDIGSEWYVEPGRRAEFRRLLDEKGQVTDFVSEIYRHKTRERIWVSENARIVRDAKTGKPLHYEGSVREITEAIHRRQLEERLEKLADNLPGGLFQLVRSPQGEYATTYVSAGFTRLLGVPRDVRTPEPSDYVGYIHPDHLADYQAALAASARELTPWTHEFRYNHPQGGTCWLHVTATPEKLADGSILWHGHLSEVTDRKRAEARVEHLAYYDSLTELPNRRVFTDRLSEAATACKRDGGHGAVLFIDLDNFKTLNDTKGHDTGDTLLRMVARRLQECVRANDVVSRFGGDEFVLLLPSLSKDGAEAVDSATGAANKILREFARGFALDFGRHHCSPSIGVVVFDASNAGAADIIKSADIAMYEAKKGGRNTFVLFDPKNLRDVSDRYLLQRELSGAIAGNELAFDFQPQMNKSGQIVAAEALLRWNHPSRGRLSPGAFVPMAEKTGLIMEINRWVVDEAISTLRRWKDDPLMSAMSLSVNISVQQFRSAEFVHSLCSRIAAAGIDARLLTLELTEHVMARDPADVAARMEELHAVGIRLSLDDFGTGYSSLSQLNRFPFDEVKIDGAFVSDIETRHANRTLIEAILGMAKGLNLETVAEHVCSPYQLEFLKARGCTLFQGFHFHPPLAETELRELMAPVRRIAG